MEFLKQIFGDSENGVRWGGVLAAVLGIGGGMYLGGGVGAALGAALGVFVGAPILNEVFFNVNRATGNVVPPPRNTSIVARPALEQAPAPVRQPDNTLSPTTIRSPILENLIPPEVAVVSRQFEARERIRRIIVDREGGLRQFEEAVGEARRLEAQTDNFITTMNAYLAQRDDYHKEGGERARLVAAVRTGLSRTGITNALTEAEIERFVPSLPTMSAAQRGEIQQHMDNCFPERVQLLGGGTDVLPLRQSIERHFTKGADGQPDAAKVQQWARKSSLEKLNFALDRLDEMRAEFESRTPINWNLAAGGSDESQAEGLALRGKTPREMYNAAQALLTRPMLRDAATEATRNTQLHAIKRYANILHARAQVEELVKEHLTQVTQTYTAFRQSQLAPAAATAREFARQRLDVFNETGIAIMARGNVEAAHGPGGKACSYLTYKDCTAAGGKETTLIMQDGHITHRIEGPLTDSMDWSAGRLQTPTAADTALFTALTPLAGKSTGASIRELVNSVKDVQLIALTDPMRTLRRQLDEEGLGEDLRFAYANASSPAAQPAGMPPKKKDKAGNSRIRPGEVVA